MPEIETSTLRVLQDENQRLKRAIEELSILNELARAISASLNPQEIMGTLIRRSLRAVQAEQGVITLVEAQKEDPTKTLVREALSSTQHEQYHLHQALLGWMHLNKKPLMVNAPETDERFRGVQWDTSVESVLCVPMITKSELKGVLTVYNKKGGLKFTDDDLRLLAIIAAQSGQIIENARLNENEKQYLKVQEEVRLAAQIQKDLLPKSPPVVPGYDIAGRNISAQQVGGDHFDFVPLGNHQLAICLGDVSGKGLPASLLMANLQATLRGLILSDPSARACVRRANALLYQSTSPEKFITLFYCVLDSARHTLSTCNAGHNYPLLLTTTETLKTLETGGPAIAMLEDFSFEEETVSLRSGDLLVIYSDGIAEAMNTHDALYGTDRLEQAIRAHRGQSANEIIDVIVQDVRNFAGAAPQADDITLVVIKRL